MMTTSDATSVKIGDIFLRKVLAKVEAAGLDVCRFRRSYLESHPDELLRPQPGRLDLGKSFSALLGASYYSIGGLPKKRLSVSIFDSSCDNGLCVHRPGRAKEAVSKYKRNAAKANVFVAFLFLFARSRQAVITKVPHNSRPVIKSPGRRTGRRQK